MEKDKGLYQKYEVKKLTNPEKGIDAIVLEFDDPISRIAIKEYAYHLHEHGFLELAKDLRKKCADYERMEKHGIGPKDLANDTRYPNG